MALQTYTLSISATGWNDSGSPSTLIQFRSSCLNPFLDGGGGFTASQIQAELLAQVQELDPAATLTVEDSAGTLTIESTLEADDASCYPVSVVVIQDDGTAFFLSGQFTIACEEPAPEVTQCAACYSVELPACQNVYTFTGGLTPSTEYIAIATDHFNNQYTQTVTTDVVGDFSIDMSEFPPGFATPENSPVQVVVRLSASGQNEAITVNNVEHPCIKVEFVNRTVAGIVLTMFITNDFGVALTNDSGEEIEGE